MLAVAKDGFASAERQRMAKAVQRRTGRRESGLAYVEFAHAQSRRSIGVMYDCARAAEIVARDERAR